MTVRVRRHIPGDCEHAYHLLSACCDGQPYGKNRDDLIQVLLDKYQLTCITQYWPVCRTDLFEEIGFGKADVPQTNRSFDNMTSIPSSLDIPDEVVDDVAHRLAGALDDMYG